MSQKSPKMPFEPAPSVRELSRAIAVRDKIDIGAAQVKAQRLIRERHRTPVQDVPLPAQQELAQPADFVTLTNAGNAGIAAPAGDIRALSRALAKAEGIDIGAAQIKASRIIRARRSGGGSSGPPEAA